MSEAQLIVVSIIALVIVAIVASRPRAFWVFLEGFGIKFGVEAERGGGAKIEDVDAGADIEALDGSGGGAEIRRARAKGSIRASTLAGKDRPPT